MLDHLPASLTIFVQARCGNRATSSRNAQATSSESANRRTAYAEEQVITAPWALKWVTAFITHGTSDKGPWTQIVVVFELQHAFGEDRAEIEAELDMDDLPQIRTRFFYKHQRRQAELPR
jgi:hypothetical protein